MGNSFRRCMSMISSGHDGSETRPSSIPSATQDGFSSQAEQAPWRRGAAGLSFPLSHESHTPSRRLRDLAGSYATAAVAQYADSYVQSRDHAAIEYSKGPVTDRVAALNRKLADGAQTLKFDGPGGYLRSALDALGIPVESQVAVFAQNSSQGPLIGMKNPRALYFADAVAIGFVRGGKYLEVAAHDPRQGVDLLHPGPDAHRRAAVQARRSVPGVPPVVEHARRPRTVRPEHADAAGRQELLRLRVRQQSHHELRSALGRLVRDRQPRVHPAHGQPSGVDDDNAGGARDEQAGFARGPIRPDRLSGTVQRRRGAAGAGTPDAHHQSDHAAGLGGTARGVRSQDGRGAVPRAPVAAKGKTSRVENAAADLVDYALFVYETPLPDKIRGSSGFAEKFSALGPADGKGRSLRQLDLDQRLMKYPCSYMIYSDAFDALPAAARIRCTGGCGRCCRARTRTSDTRCCRPPIVERSWKSCGRRRRICPTISRPSRKTSYVVSGVQPDLLTVRLKPDRLTVVRLKADATLEEP